MMQLSSTDNFLFHYNIVIFDQELQLVKSNQKQVKIVVR